jgi:CDP-glucose 4,6-dehydratase
VSFSIDDAPQPHEAPRLRLDCRKAVQRLRWHAVWDLPTTLQRSARWYRRQHEQGAVDSRADLQQYVADARGAGLAWAA